ncbi:hypothetical protein ID866_8537 [Astraeus odoratus]|nr:hypothetical protein ID866_8537 [Astraeus odoratus]
MTQAWAPRLPPR